MIVVLGWVLPDSRSAQSPASQARFTARSEMVTVPAVITDKSGTHIPNLKKEDFIVEEESKEQKIAVFEEIKKTDSRVRRAPVLANQFSNVVGEDSQPPRLTVVVLDMVNSPFADQAYARGELLKYLAESVDEHQPTALFTISRTGLKVIHDFTTRTEILAAALKKVKGQPQPATPLSVQDANSPGVDPGDAIAVSQESSQLSEFQRKIDQPFNSFQARLAIVTTLEAMRQIAQALTGLPGRKALVWASAGFPFSINDSSMIFSNPTLESVTDVLPLYEDTWKRLNEAQVAVYPVDVRGLNAISTPLLGAGSNRLGDNSRSRGQFKQMDIRATFQTFAEATGGRAFFSTNDLKDAFQKASDDNASYYLLGYYLDRTGKQPGWRRLHVNLKQNGAQIRARSGFFLTKLSMDSEKNAQSEIETALGSLLDYTAFPVTAEWRELVSAPEPRKKKAIFYLRMGANFADIDESDHNHMLVTIAAMARTETGARADATSHTIDGHLKPEQMEEIQKNGMGYRGNLTLPPGEYTVRFVVQDRRSGRIASVAAPLNVAP